jgi:cysteinyl-tRNA synthetase
MQEFIASYIVRLEDNFNTPEALAVFHEFLKFVNTGIRNKEFSKTELQSLLDMFMTFNEVLAIVDFEILKENDEVPEEILKKFEERNQAKKSKDFEKADKIREELLAL